MTSYAPTTIAALCFAKPTRIDFQSLTRNLGTAFAAAQAAGDCITAAHDDFVIYDLGRARVWLCYADFTADLSEALGAGGLPAEGLIVAVGPGPGAPASDPLYTDRADLCRGLAREINRAAPADHLMVFDHERMITSDIYDELVDLVGRLARPDAAHRTVTVAPFLSERPVIPGRHTPSEPSRPTHAARSADRTAVDAVGWADATQRAEAAALREALHAEDDAADDTGTAMDGVPYPTAGHLHHEQRRHHALGPAGHGGTDLLRPRPRGCTCARSRDRSRRGGHGPDAGGHRRTAAVLPGLRRNRAAPRSPYRHRGEAGLAIARRGDHLGGVSVTTRARHANREIHLPGPFRP